MLSNVISNQLETLRSLGVRQFKTNSADVIPGDAFVCRQGITLDGHDYAMKAIEKGACAIIANKPMQLNVPIIITESYYQSLALIKAYFNHPHKDITHIGVTGTNGKTTVSHCLNQALNIDNRSAYIGTLGAKLIDVDLPLNNTTPDGVTLLNIFNDMRCNGIDFNVMELSSHALIQDRAGFVSLKVGVITNIGQDHLDFHRTKDGYVQAKLQLIDRIQCNGTLVLNLDDPHSLAAMERASGRVNVFSFSLKNPMADLVASEIRTTEFGMRFNLSFAKKSVEVNSNMPFLYNVENALAVAGTLLTLGWDLKGVSTALSKIVMPEGRAQFVSLEDGRKGLIDYAHNSDGIKALLSSVQSIVKNRLIVVVGVTGDRIQQAANIGEICAEYADSIIFTSDNPMGVVQSDIFRALSSKVGHKPHFEINDRVEAIKLAKQLSGEGDLILLCGKGGETFQYINNGKWQKQNYIGDLAALQENTL
ncbi:Mur ligase family protein [Vibrio sp. M60_M70]|uniref:Mur ligase family protein n=1 Tax=Vibrio sp. M60_M70 TaxID=3035166 RepID=UPI00301E59FF